MAKMERDTRYNGTTTRPTLGVREGKSKSGSAFPLLLRTTFPSYPFVRGRIKTGEAAPPNPPATHRKIKNIKKHTHLSSLVHINRPKLVS